jgi:hypothetical protein
LTTSLVTLSDIDIVSGLRSKVKKWSPPYVPW